MKENNNGFWKGLIGGVVLTAVAAAGLFFLADLPGRYRANPAVLTQEEADALVEKFDQLKLRVDTLYLEDITPEKHQEMLEAAYAAYVDALGDKYTVYFTKEEYEEYTQELSGSYSGIGVTVQLDAEEELARVIAVNPKGPSAGSGMEKGDLIVAVDGTDVKGFSLDEVVALVKGEEGSSVTLRLRRPETGEEFEITVVRRHIELETVTFEDLGNGIGYIYILEFDEITDDQFAEALLQVKKLNLRGLILDVRQNPGGYLDVVTNMADRLLPRGIITYTQDKYGKREVFESDAACLKIPMVLLCDGDSASAAELFTGALKDYGVAEVIGTTTFGKGIVQRSTLLPDGSAMKVTVSRYYTPNGVCIHQTGITPDYPVELPEGVYFSTELPHDEDPQFQKALEVLEAKLEGAK